MLRSIAILPLLLFISLFTTSRADEKVTKGPAPAWVITHPLDHSKTPDDKNSSILYLLADYQEHIEEKTMHQAFATRILTPAGVEEYSQISIDFQPSYQNLVWNRLEVIRDGITQDRLEAAEFDTIRREEGMESQLYNGKLTSHVILKDIRLGDIISYSYTITGVNPIFNGHSHDFIQISFSIPVQRIHRSFIWNAATRPLRWQVLGGDRKIKEETLENGLRRVSYEGLSVPKTETENSTPDWFNDYPYLEISDYSDWASFGKWAYDIYHTEETLPPALAKICNDIRAEGGTDAENAIKVLRWVQSNVRYLGSFFGAHTHAPYPLSEIDSRRFGDCKDKGTMTVAMLRHLGLDAAPALVDVDTRSQISQQLPGHYNFDHLIVHLLLDGKDYWLDPTRTFQRGTLDNQYSPDYGLAFVIRKDANSLSKVLPSGFNETQTDLHEKFSIRDDDGNGTLTVKTIATGANADSLRRTFATDSHSELEENYREFYERDYPGIKVSSPLSFTDEEAANRITILEKYDLINFFKKPATPGGLATASVYARSIATYFSTPDSKPRLNPLGVSHPVNYKHTIVIDLPKRWEVNLKNISTSLPAINYTYLPSVKKRRLTLSHHYQSLADHVLPADFANYRQTIIDADANLYFEFTYPIDNKTIAATTSDKTNEVEKNTDPLTNSHILLAAVTLVGIFVGLALSLALYFWDPPVRHSDNPRLSGLGGWLVLPIIGCCILPFLTIYLISTYFSNLGPDNVDLFSDTKVQNKWRIYYCIAVFIEALTLPLSFIQIFLLFRRRTSFPYLFLGFEIMFFCSIILNQALLSYADSVNDLATFVGDITRSVIRVGIWGTYMIVSQRVRATFTRRRKTSAPPQTSAPPPLPPLPQQS